MSSAFYLVKHYRRLLLAVGVALLLYGLAAHAVSAQVAGVVLFFYAVLGGT